MRQHEEQARGGSAERSWADCVNGHRRQEAHEAQESVQAMLHRAQQAAKGTVLQYQIDSGYWRQRYPNKQTMGK